MVGKRGNTVCLGLSDTIVIRGGFNVAGIFRGNIPHFKRFIGGVISKMWTQMVLAVSKTRWFQILDSCLRRASANTPSRGFFGGGWGGGGGGGG